jgi:two-component system, cell cycle sensor histidine kinase and response regulator CckA
MDDFYRLTHIGVAVLDLHGEVLVATGWQDICTQFHRVHPETSRHCLESDLMLSNGVAPGAFKLYRCKNNMWDMATPIMVGDIKVGNLFLGQFFFEEEMPDREMFRQQAQRYGFDEAAYLAALEQAPRWSRETVDTVMNFYTRFASLVSELGDRNVRLSQALAEKEALLDELRQSEDKYRVLTESAAEAVFVVQDGRLKFANSRVEELIGYPRAEIFSRPFTDFIYPEDRAMVQDRHLQRLQGADLPSTYTFRLLTSSGEPWWVELHTAAIEWEGQPATLNLLTDIAERVRAETTLRESEERHRTLLESIQDSVYVLDREWRHLMVNDAAERFTGIPKEKLLGNKLTDLFPGVESTPFFKAFQQAMESREPTVVEDEYVFADGHSGWYEVNVYPVPQGILCISHDITERKRLDAERRTLQRQLLQGQKLEAVGRLAGGVAHDFNNMLTAILGYAELALDETTEGSFLHKSMSEIQAVARRSVDLTRQLLAFARQETAQPRVLDLNEVIAGTLKLLRRLIGEDIHLRWIPGADVWLVKIDAAQIDQVLANLTVNARDAIEDVGEITIKTNNVSVDEAYAATHAEAVPGEYVLITVSDTGVGMDTQTLSHIFEPFFTTKGVSEGTGLGLSTVYGIIKQNHGFINVYSEPGQGSTFEMYLPRCTEVMAARRMPAPSTAILGGTETLLLVEDEAPLLELTRMILDRLGYRVLAAGTPGEAIELAQTYEGEIHLLITDVVLPHMNGKKLAERIQELRPEIKCLFTSGYTANVIAERGVVDREVHFIQKPFVLRNLSAKLREVLDG